MRTLSRVFLNITFWPLFILYTVFYTVVMTSAVAFLSIFLSHRRTMRRFRRAISWYGKGVLLLSWPWIRICYRDMASLDEGTAVVLVCNHRSSSDPFLMACLPGELIQIVNVWPFRLPLLGPFAKWAGYLSINEMPPEEFFERGEDLLAQGTSIVAFPEGTRSGSLEMGPFHGTIFRLALRTRAPIVPLCISGNENKPSRGSLQLEPGAVKIHRLPALEWADYKDLSPFQLKNKVRDLIAEELVGMDNGVS